MKSFLTILAMLCTGAGWAADTMAPATSLKGKVLEVRDVESYTYLRLKTPGGETWAAVSSAPVKVGSEVTIEDATVMNNFESRSLKRKFDKIVFGNLGGSGVPAGGPMARPHAAAANAAAVPDEKVAKAVGPNARTVAEVVAGGAALKDKPVLVRGKVVKYSAEILGKNWVHLRDGTGSAADNSNDILVTTKDQAKVGDVVTAKGTVRTDRDLGAGYFYKVLVEEATLQK